MLTARPALPATPAIRWSVSSDTLVELTDQGIRPRDTSTARGQASSRRVDSRSSSRSAGVYPLFISALVVVCSCRSSVNP